MRMKFTASIIVVITCSALVTKDDVISRSFAHAEQQTKVLLKEVDLQLEKNRAENKKPEPVSPRTIKAGELVMVPSRDWTSGFFPGVLWYLYEYTGKQEWLAEA